MSSQQAVQGQGDSPTTRATAQPPSPMPGAAAQRNIPGERDLFVGWQALRRTVYALAFTLIPLLPIACVRLLGWALGLVAFSVDGRGRRLVAHNLAPAMPGASASALARAVRRNYQLFCMSIGEGMHLHRLPATAAQPPALRIIDPWAALAQRPLRGPLILTSIHSNWEIGAALLHLAGISDHVHGVALSHRDPMIDRLFARQRAHIGVSSILLDAAPLASLRILHGHGVLGLVGDRDYSGSGLALPLLGRHIVLPIGPAALAVQTGASIVPVYVCRLGWSSFAIVAGRPLRAQEPDKRAEVLRLTRQLATWHGRCIRTAPAQWVAFHPMWADYKNRN